MIIAGIFATLVTNLSRNERLGIAAYLVAATLIVACLATGTSPNMPVVTTVYEHEIEHPDIKVREICTEDPRGRVVCRPYGL